jgi:hypothetical protein
VLDNAYTINNNRTFVSSKVDLDDMLENPIGGVVRVNSERLGGQPCRCRRRCSRSARSCCRSSSTSRRRRNSAPGIRATTKGLDAELAEQDRDRRAHDLAAGQERSELISRVFAETGLADLMISLHGLIRRHGEQADTVRLRNQWVSVDPRNWVTREQTTVNVGLGTGDKQLTAQQMQLILQAQREAIPSGLSDAPKIFNALSKWTVSMGYKDPHEFWNDPTAPDFKQPPPQPSEAEKVAAIEQQGKTAEVQAKTAETERRLNLENDQHTLQTERQMELEKYKADNNQKTAIITKLVDVAAAAVGPQTTTTPDGQTQSTTDQSGIDWAAFLKDVMIGADPGMQSAEMFQMMLQQQQQQTQMMGQMMSELASSIHALAKSHAAPRVAVRDASGTLLGTKAVLDPSQEQA